MSYPKSKTKKVLKGSEYNTDSEGKPVQSDRAFKSFYHRPKGQSEVKEVELTPLQVAYFRERFQLKRDSRNRK